MADLKTKLSPSVALLFTALCVIVAFGACSQSTPPVTPSGATGDQETASAVEPGNLSEITVGNVYRLVEAKAALIYDVRPALFYSIGHIPNAISFPKDYFEEAISKHKPEIEAANKNNTPVIVYCTDAKCPDALLVANQLVARGHDISILEGGYETWKKVTKSDNNH